MFHQVLEFFFFKQWQKMVIRRSTCETRKGWIHCTVSRTACVENRSKPYLSWHIWYLFFFRFEGAGKDIKFSLRHSHPMKNCTFDWILLYRKLDKLRYRRYWKIGSIIHLPLLYVTIKIEWTIIIDSLVRFQLSL